MKRGELLGKAIVIATNAHAGQFDRGGKPYILHPLAGLSLVDSNDEEVLAMVVLHDTIEDTNLTYQDLRDQGMTERVINGVRNVTKIPGETLDEYKERVFSSIDSILVKEADLTHNSDIRRLKGVTEKDIQRMVKYHTFYLELQARKKELLK